MTMTDALTWTAVCELARIPVDAGVAALLPDGEQVAVFRVSNDDVYAIGNVDPIGGAAVLARGIVGDVDGTPVVASPLYKERFDLCTGECLDGDASVPVYPVRVTGGVVHIGTV